MITASFAEMEIGHNLENCEKADCLKENPNIAETLLKKYGKMFGMIHEDAGTKAPSLEFFLNFAIMHRFYTFDEYYQERSTDGGETAQILEPGTTGILSHEAVSRELETFCQRWASGQVKIRYKFF